MKDGGWRMENGEWRMKDEETWSAGTNADRYVGQ